MECVSRFDVADAAVTHPAVFNIHQGLAFFFLYGCVRHRFTANLSITTLIFCFVQHLPPLLVVVYLSQTDRQTVVDQGLQNAVSTYFLRHLSVSSVARASAWLHLGPVAH